jgi:hypothetical protein
MFLMKQRNSWLGFKLSIHLLRHNFGSEGLLSTQYWYAFLRSCSMKSLDLRSNEISANEEHFKVFPNAIQAASFGALQFNLGNTEPPSSSIAFLTRESNSGNSGGSASSSALLTVLSSSELTSYSPWEVLVLLYPYRFNPATKTESANKYSTKFPGSGIILVGIVIFLN